MNIKQETKERIVFAGLLLMKALTTIRTGVDTYAVSNDILNVLLLDVAFLGFWLVLAYTGKGNTAMAVRPFAGIAALVMYLIMMGVGWEAHEGQTLVVFGVRIAGLLVLAYDGYDYAVAWWQRRQDRIGRTLGEKQRYWRERMWESAYKKAANRKGTQFDKLSDGHLLSDMEADTDYRESLPVIPVRRQLSAGQAQQVRSQNVPSTFLEREVDLTRASVIRRWSEVCPKLPDTFTRKDVEELCNCAKTQAYEAIMYGRSTGEVIEANERGLYQKVVVIDGEVSEDSKSQ